jgi:hypothetical protein
MISITGLFTKEAIIAYLKSAPVIKTPVLDLIFTDRPQLALPRVGQDIMEEVVAELPLVRRGGASISTGGDSGGMGIYEPLSIRPNKMITGAALNDLNLLGKGGLKVWSREKMENLRKRVRKTTEAMCAVALTGKLSWPVKLEGGGWETWEIDFGSILSITPGTLWSAGNATLKDVFITLQEMEEKIQERGYGGTVEIWAGKTAYNTLFGLAEASKTTAKIRVELTDQGINIGGYLVKRRSEKYKNPQTGTLTSIVAAKKVLMVGTDGGHKMPYCALDDLDANLQPLPFFVKPITLKDPSGYKLVAESKPLPIPNVKAICEAQVVS